MLKSKWCHLHKLNRDELIAKGEDPDEPGGYFIINGTEKVIITIEDLCIKQVPDRKRHNDLEPYCRKTFSSTDHSRFRILLKR